MTSNTMSNLQSSLLKFINDFTLTQPGFVFVNFDDHANEETAPPGNLIGPMGFGFEIEDQFISVEQLFGVATESDTNLFLLNNTMGQLVELLKPTKRIRIVDSENGVDLGWMVVRGKLRVMPVGGSSAKALRYVAVNLLTAIDYTAPE